MVIPSRAKNYKTCSYECSSIRIKNKTVLNSTCTNCKKEFHIKESQVKRYNRNMGIFCSTKCATTYKKLYYLGENNPNYRGRQYDNDGYRINHYPKIGRKKEHRYVVETYLNVSKISKGYVVHHRDCNIYNNSVNNLVVLSESDHRWLHKQYGNATLWAYMNEKVTLMELISWSNDPEKASKLLPMSLENQKDIFKDNS